MMPGRDRFASLADANGACRVFPLRVTSGLIPERGPGLELVLHPFPGGDDVRFWLKADIVG